MARTRKRTSGKPRKRNTRATAARKRAGNAEAALDDTPKLVIQNLGVDALLSVPYPGWGDCREHLDRHDYLSAEKQEAAARIEAAMTSPAPEQAVAEIIHLLPVFYLKPEATKPSVDTMLVYANPEVVLSAKDMDLSTFPCILVPERHLPFVQKAIAMSASQDAAKRNAEDGDWRDKPYYLA